MWNIQIGFSGFGLEYFALPVRTPDNKTVYAIFSILIYSIAIYGILYLPDKLTVLILTFQLYFNYNPGSHRFHLNKLHPLTFELIKTNGINFKQYIQATTTSYILSIYSIYYTYTGPCLNARIIYLFLLIEFPSLIYSLFSCFIDVQH